MSVDTVVVFDKRKMVATSEWKDTIVRHGFDMQLDDDFDVEEFIGFLPCTYRGEEAGFEYEFDDLDEDMFDEDEVGVIGDRDSVIVLTTHSDSNEYMSAVIAAAVLCSLVDGLLLDDGEPPFITADESVEWAKQSEVD